MAYGFKSLLDKDGAEIKMRGYLDAAGVFHPVHQSEIYSIQQSQTRPANTTPYTAGDYIGPAVGAAMQFDIGALGLGAALIVGARLIRNQTTNSTVRFRAIVHDAALASTPAADNDAHPLLWTNRASRRGWIDFSGALSGFGAGGDSTEWSGYLSNTQGIAVAPADGIIRATLLTLDAFTPESAAISLIELDLVV